MNKFVYALIFITIISSSKLNTWVYAATLTASPAATSSANNNEDDPEVTQSIKERIQVAIEKNLGITNSNVPTGLVGKIDSVTNQSISLSINGSVVQITVNETTEIVDEDDQELSIEDLAIDGGAIVVGSEDNSGLFNAVKIISIEEIPQPSLKVTLIGNITSLNVRQRSINISATNGEEYFIEANNNSDLYEQFTKDELAITDLNINDKVILIFETNEDDENILVHLNRLEISTNDEVENEAL